LRGRRNFRQVQRADHFVSVESVAISRYNRDAEEDALGQLSHVKGSNQPPNPASALLSETQVEVVCRLGRGLAVKERGGKSV